MTTVGMLDRLDKTVLPPHPGLANENGLGSVGLYFAPLGGRPSDASVPAPSRSLSSTVAPPTASFPPPSARAGRYDDIYRMDEIKSLSFYIMLYRLFRGVAKYIVYGTFSSFG